MESTGSYWKPVYNIFEEEQIPIMVVNAQHIKGVPGRKTDVKKLLIIIFNKRHIDHLIKCYLHFTKESNVFTYRVKFSRYKFISKAINLLTP